MTDSQPPAAARDDAAAPALYVPTDDPTRYLATEWTAGPWGAGLQHGGPPSALLARAVEHEPAERASTVVRMAVEILGPVPVGEVMVTSRVARAGRSVELVEAELAAAGRVAARARGWRIRRTELDLPAEAVTAEPAPPLPPEPAAAPSGRGAPSFLAAMDLRFAAGAWEQPGPATVWARLEVPLVAGEQTSGLQRLMTLADCGNGVSARLPLERWLFINPDLTVHLAHYPQGEWLCLDATTTVDASGFAVAASTLYDQHGLVGYGAQSLFVERR